jgi:inorganic pyrophosphatase
MAMLESFINNILEMFLDQNMPNNFGLIISREHLNPSDAYEILYENLFKELFGILCKLLSVLMNKDEKDQDIIISVNTILGQIISFKLFKHTLLRYLEIEKMEKKHIEAIKEKVVCQTKAIIKLAGGE